MNVRKIQALCVASAALMALSAVAFAQAPPGAPGGAGGRGGRGGQGGQGGRGGGRQQTLANMPIASLDAAVHLTPDQKTRITAVQEKLRADSRAMRPQGAPGAPGQGGPPDPALMQKMGDMNKAATAQIEAILTPDQKAKYKAAATDFALSRSLRVPYEFLTTLKLTGDQKSKIDGANKEMMAQMQGLSQADRQAKGRELFTASRAKIEGILTPAQKAAVDKYIQDHPRGRGGRGGAGGPGGPAGGAPRPRTL